MGNVVWGNGSAGIQVGPTSSNTDVFNNTSYNNQRDIYNTGTWRGEICSSIASGNTFKNNVAYSIVGSGILANNTPYLGGNPLDATNSWASNIAFGATPQMYSPDAYPTPLNKTNSDPLFMNAEAGNFALKDGSPAIGFGAIVPYWQQQVLGQIDVGACPRDATTCP